MSKTPYEIRLELLRLAKEALSEQANSKNDLELKKFHSSRETFMGEDGPRAPLEFPKIETLPTIDQIIKEAEKLNDFVSKQ